MTLGVEEVVAGASADLLRLGFVLTGDAARSRTLVLAALARVTRRRLRNADDPVAQVRRAMAREYAGWPGDEGYGLASSAHVGAALGVLTPRQRAVTVLRYGEGLRDTDAARALGAKVGTVKNDASLALSRMRAAFPDDERPDATALGHDLETYFTTAAPGQVGAGLSAVEVARCLRTARRRRAIRTGVVAAAATAVVAGGVAAVVSIDGSDTPASVATTTTPEHTETAVMELTPDDFAGLAIGMTVDEVEAIPGTVIGPAPAGTDCDAQVHLGQNVRGYFYDGQPPGAPDPQRADLVLRDVLYFGDDAVAVGGIHVGMSPQAADDRAQAVGSIEASLGPAALSMVVPSARWDAISAVGYVTIPGCGSSSPLGVPE